MPTLSTSAFSSSIMGSGCQGRYKGQEPFDAFNDAVEAHYAASQRASKYHAYPVMPNTGCPPQTYRIFTPDGKLHSEHSGPEARRKSAAIVRHLNAA